MPRDKIMIRLEQITAIFLAAGLAIPSYWFFWSLAGGGGYDRRQIEELESIENIDTNSKKPLESSSSFN